MRARHVLSRDDVRRDDPCAVVQRRGLLDRVQARNDRLWRSLLLSRRGLRSAHRPLNRDDVAARPGGAIIGAGGEVRSAALYSWYMSAWGVSPPGFQALSDGIPSVGSSGRL